MCLAGASATSNGPGAVLRGGSFEFDTGAGPLTVDGILEASESDYWVGFRCVR